MLANNWSLTSQRIDLVLVQVTQHAEDAALTRKCCRRTEVDSADQLRKILLQSMSWRTDSLNDESRRRKNARGG